MCPAGNFHKTVLCNSTERNMKFSRNIPSVDMSEMRFSCIFWFLCVKCCFQHEATPDTL